MPRLRRQWARLLFALPFLAILSLCGAALAAAPASPAQTVYQETTYINADAFFARFGLQAQWLKTGEQRLFKSAWTRVELTKDQRELSYNGLRVFLGEAVLARGQSLWIPKTDADRLLAPILRPAGIRVTRPLRTIVIDAGHGGKDSGTRNSALKLDEKKLTLDLARRVASLLKGGEWRVIMTRTDDRYISLEDRSRQAASAKADLFISIHLNAVDNAPNVVGTETYILTPSGQRSTAAAKRAASDSRSNPGNAYDEWNAVLGYHMHRQLLAKLGTVDRGLKRARFAVLKQAACPAILIEAGYLSNRGEARKLATPAYRSDIAEAIVNGVKAYATFLSSAGGGSG